MEPRLGQSIITVASTKKYLQRLQKLDKAPRKKGYILKFSSFWFSLYPGLAYSQEYRGKRYFGTYPNLECPGLRVHLVEPPGFPHAGTNKVRQGFDKNYFMCPNSVDLYQLRKSHLRNRQGRHVTCLIAHQQNWPCTSFVSFKSYRRTRPPWKPSIGSFLPRGRLPGVLLQSHCWQTSVATHL